MLPKSSVAIRQAAEQMETSQLRPLLADAAALQGLIDFLETAVQKADQDFDKAARKAAFDPDARMDAVHKHGIKKGVEMLFTRLVQLRSTAK
jgi:hypothetical protein